jgi:hypothetical protein
MAAQSDIFLLLENSNPSLPSLLYQTKSSICRLSALPPECLSACLSVSWSVGQSVSFLVFSTHSCRFIASPDAKFLCFLTLSTSFSDYTSGYSQRCLPPCDHVVMCLGHPPCVLCVHIVSTYYFPLLQQLFVLAPFLSNYFISFF